MMVHKPREATQVSKPEWKVRLFSLLLNSCWITPTSSRMESIRIAHTRIAFSSQPGYEALPPLLVEFATYGGRYPAERMRLVINLMETEADGMAGVKKAIFNRALSLLF